MYAELFAPLLQRGVVELFPVVEDHQSWYAEPCDDVLPYELADLRFGDGGDSFSFDPFAKIVDSYNQPLLLVRS